MVEHIYALIDPRRAPETAENIREYVRQHGPAGMTTTAGQLNPRKITKLRRNEAFASHPPVRGMARDEEPPAIFRKKGDPFVLRITSVEESHCKCNKPSFF